MAISLGGFSGGGGGGNITSVNGQTGIVVISGDDVAADHSASHYTAANSNIDGHLSGIDTKLGTLASGLTYKGTFNATAGTPSLIDAEQGDLYVIDTAGTIYSVTWAIGDHLLVNADMGGSITNSKIDKIDNTDAPASETVAGVIEIATNAEATAGTATDKALVPSNLSGIALSTLNNDLSFVSNGDNVSVLNNDAGYLTSVASASETVAGKIEIATNAEATAGTATDKALVPSNLSGIALSTLSNDLS